jgi:outer membrane protein TolC
MMLRLEQAFGPVLLGVIMRIRWATILILAFGVIPGLASAQTSPAAPAPLVGATTRPLISADAKSLGYLGPARSGLTDYTRSQELTLTRAKDIALDNNLDLANSRRDVRLAELDITRTKGSYDPYLRADASYSNKQQPTSLAVFGNKSESESLNVSSGVSTITGGNVSLAFNNSRSDSNSIFNTLNPSYSTDLTLNLSQPLLKNRFNDIRSMELSQKHNDLERAKLSLVSKGLEIEAQVEDNYWGLTRARQDLELKRRSLELAERMDLITSTQVRAGTAARVSTTQTQANVASAKASLVRSENDFRKAQFALKMVMNLEADDLWYLEVIPTDSPRYQPPVVSRDDLIKEAMANNFALRQTRLSLDSTEIGNQQAKNRTLPQLDFRASVGVSGLAGTDNSTGSIVETGFVIPNPLPPSPFPQPYMVERTVVAGQPSQYAGNYGDAVKNMLDANNLSWSAGLTFNMPIGNRAAEADYQRTMLNYEKQVSDLHNQERQVFMNLINLIYDLDASQRSYLAATEASRLQGQNLEVEERKFSVGLNTNYEVMQAKESWAEARSGEIGALVDYTKTTGRIERARQGYLGGGSTGSLSISIPSLSSITGGGGLPSGIDMSQIQSMMGQLPAGIDINTIRQYLP